MKKQLEEALQLRHEMCADIDGHYPIRVCPARPPSDKGHAQQFHEVQHEGIGRTTRPLEEAEGRLQSHGELCTHYGRV